MEQTLTKFTLWIVPPRNIADELQRIMSIRKDEPHSPTTYPVFEPHITLASVQSEIPIPLSTIRGSIPATQHPFKVKFQSVDVGDHYFRSVYIAIHLDEALINLHQTVHEKLHMSPRTPKYPHVSLAYISDEDADDGERERYYEELQTKQLISIKGKDGVGLRGSRESEWIEGFMASEIWIAECVGPVETWKVLDKITLQHSD